jgi:hypothetical protein
MARDNVLTVLCDERKEVVFGRALPAREIERMRSVNVVNRDKDQETDEEGEKERGISARGFRLRESLPLRKRWVNSAEGL